MRLNEGCNAHKMPGGEGVLVTDTTFEEAFVIECTRRFEGGNGMGQQNLFPLKIVSAQVR